MITVPAWVDRARVIRKVRGPRVEGETILTTRTGPWFPCRMPPQESSEQQQDNVWTLEDTRELSASLIAEDGTRVEMGPQDRLEVQFGLTHSAGGTWEIQRCYVPRDGNGVDLLWVITVTKRREQ